MNWMDILWLLFLAGLALLPPVFEIHKQLVLLAFGIVQLSEEGRAAAFKSCQQRLLALSEGGVLRS